MRYYDNLKTVLSELQSALLAVDEDEIEAFVVSLMRTNRVFAVGVGRVQLSLLAFVKRLNHLGIKATYVGAIDEPAIGEGDMLLIGSGSGETAVPVTVAKIAQKYGARIVHIGSNTHSTVSSIADLTVRIPCRTKLALEDEINSIQPMSSLFEQSLLIFFDVVSLLLIEKKGIDIKALWHTHANLE